MTSNLCECPFCMRSICDEDSCFQEGSKILYKVAHFDFRILEWDAATNTDSDLPLSSWSHLPRFHGKWRHFHLAPAFSCS